MFHVSQHAKGCSVSGLCGSFVALDDFRKHAKANDVSHNAKVVLSVAYEVAY